MLDFVFGVLGTILYPLFSVIFIAVDGLQSVFFAFAGIGDIRFDGKNIGAGNTGAENDTGIIYYLFQNSLVKNMLISIMLLALFLIIIFTVMAFIKNAYAAKQKGWKEIVGNAIKGLGNFILIPVICMLGVWLGNILLQAINGATSHGGATNMSRKLFTASSYNANIFRNDNEEAKADDEKVQKLKDWIALLNFPADVAELFGEDWDKIQNIESGQTNGYYADIVDKIYATSWVSIYDWVSVGMCYDLWEINYLILIVGGIFMCYVLGSLAFGMVRRLFILTILFIVSPGVCAIYPLDEGKAVGQWKDKFIKEFLSVYGSIAGVNIFFSLLPLIDSIQIAGGGTQWNSTLSSLIQIFILVVGLMCVKEVTGLVSGFVGAEDAYSKSTGTIKSTVGKAAKTAVGAAGVFAIASATKKGGGSFFGSLAKQGKDAALGAAGIDTGKFKKNMQEAKEHGHDARDARAKKAKEKKTAAAVDEALGVKAHSDAERAAAKAEYHSVGAAKGFGKVSAVVKNAGIGIKHGAKRAGGAVARTAGFGNTDTYNLTDDATYFGAMEGLSEPEQKELARRRAVQLNRKNDRGAQRVKGLGPDATAGQKFAAFWRSSESVASEETELQKYQEYKKNQTAEENIVAESGQFETAQTRVDEAKNAQTAAAAAHEAANQAVEAAESRLRRNADGSLDLDTIDVSVLSVKATERNETGGFTDAALDAQQKWQEANIYNANIDKYNEAKQAQRQAEQDHKAADQEVKAAEQDFEAVAEALQKRLEAAGETFKGEAKKAATALSEELRKAIETHTLDSTTIGTLRTAIENLAKGVKKNLRTTNADGSNRKLEELMKDLLEAVKKK